MNFINISKGALAAVLLALAVSACSDVDFPQTPTEPSVTSLDYTIEGRSVTLNWTLPEGDIESTQLYSDNVLLAELDPGVTSYTIKRQSANREVLYTLKLKYANGISSLGKTVAVTIEAQPSLPAMIIPCDSEADLEDDDEIAALEWFKTPYPQGALLTPDKIQNLDPDNYSVIWINIDRVGLAQGYRKLPKTISGTEPVKALKEYLALGGNLFLTKHATQMVVPTGIISSMYAPGIFGSGEGGEGSDNWAMNAVIGSPSLGEVYDHRSHDIFAGLATIPDFGHETFALEGPGWREDHNCCWDLNTYGFPGEPNTVADFEKATNSIVLATWAHVVDYCVAGIVEFLPTDERPGRCLAIGLSAYEFKQNTGNPFQSNVERLTKNCIDYLSR